MEEEGVHVQEIEDKLALVIFEHRWGVPIPCHTRWGSWFWSLVKVLRFKRALEVRFNVSFTQVSWLLYLNRQLLLIQLKKNYCQLSSEIG